uniref:Uncharacterized protein n=1 Tax=Anguilla anguilla TaxID=7936 RepID=A0A0E9XRX6_ANGAN
MRRSVLWGLPAAGSLYRNRSAVAMETGTTAAFCTNLFMLL